MLMLHRCDQSLSVACNEAAAKPPPLLDNPRRTAFLTSVEDYVSRQLVSCIIVALVLSLRLVTCLGVPERRHHALCAHLHAAC
jgi:hypothetical protein